MRIQTLLLPHVVFGEATTQPFALIVDQYEGPFDPATVARWSKFREECGAQALAFHPGTVEVVDRYAEPAKAEPAAPSAIGGRWWSPHIEGTKVTNVGPIMSPADIEWAMAKLKEPEPPTSASAPECIGQDRCAGDNCPKHRDMP